MSAHTDDSIPRHWLCATGSALAALGAMVLVGRLAGWAPLVTVIPNGAPMAFSSAVAFLLSGMAFFAHGRGAARTGQIIAASLTVLAVTLAGLEISRVVHGVEKFYFDPRQLIVSGSTFGGRMSLNSALAFALLGAALWLLGSPRLRLPWIVGCASVLLGISALALLSYFTGLRWSILWWRVTAMAVHTSAGLLLAAATLFGWVARLTKGPRLATSRTLPFFAGAGTALLVLGIVMIVGNEQRREIARSAAAALDLQAAVDRFTAAVAQMETATRNFLITGDARYSERFQAHRASVRASVAELQQLASGDATREQLAQRLAPLIEQKFASNEVQLALRRERGLEAVRETLRAESTDVAASLRNAAEALRAEAVLQLAELQTEARASERIVRCVLIAGVLIAIGLVVIAFRLVDRAQSGLQRANDELEERVRARTAELEASVAEVHERERRLRFLADSLPQLVWTARPDGTIESLNRGYLEYLGVGTEPEGIAALDHVVHPDDAAEESEEWTTMFRDRRSGGGELRLRRGDGAYRWHLWRAHPECDTMGRIARWVGTSTDIHDKKILEERLEQRMEERTAELVTSEGRFRQSFQFAGIGMAIVGLDGRFLRVNHSLCEIVGYAESDLLQRTFQDITHPDDLQSDLAQVRDLIEGRRRFFQMEKRYFHRDGRIVWIRLTASLVRDAEAAPVHFVSQIEDITERNQLEANLAAARDQAIEASRLKSEFLATMSHEIRTPMSGVIGMTSLLRHTPLTRAQTEYVRTIENSGEALLAIIDDILDYSKIEAGRMELEVVPFDLGECIQNALDLFTARAAEKKLRLTVSLAVDVPVRVAGDVTRLRQILTNLIGNAVKFTDAGEIVVRVSAEPSPVARRGSAQQLVSFAVKDTGIGMPAEGMSRLFKSFSQVDASTTRRFGGTGLGLAISKRLAELMGGTMWAESALGRGSTFYFNVVLAQETASATAEPSSAASIPGTGRETPLAERCPLRLLLVEDNPLNQRVANLLLERLGYRAESVSNGREALDAASARDYDVILMDIEMPELDGCEATRRIRALRSSPTRPWIIALTAGATVEHRERAMSAGMNDYLTKPARSELISAALARAHAALAATPRRL